MTPAKRALAAVRYGATRLLCLGLRQNLLIDPVVEILLVVRAVHAEYGVGGVVM